MLSCVLENFPWEVHCGWKPFQELVWGEDWKGLEVMEGQRSFGGWR